MANQFDGVLMDRMSSKFLIGDNCWEWIGYKTKKGYGEFYFDGIHYIAHREMWHMFNGAIPESLCIDHLCRNRGCVRPAHMELVTPEENTRRGEVGKKSGAIMSAKTHCPRGHSYAGDNVYVEAGSRKCRECKRARQRDAYHRLKAEKACEDNG